MNFLHGNDKKRIKSALNDKKTKWSKISNSRSNLLRDNLEVNPESWTQLRGSNEA
jgi:hypothetical protein